VRNVNFSNIIARDINTVFYLVGGCRTRQQQSFRTPRPGLMEHISITNVLADGTGFPSFIVGHPDQPIRDVVLSNIHIRKTRGVYDHIPGPPRAPDRYPTIYMFGSRAGDELPAFGLYQSNTERVTLRDFTVESIKPDARPCFAGNESNR
ncbi:MAG TPA: hypothetical protein VG722_05725, partial [Tepidisphaeraceae bacterium]|nr:hypothetical protein [Tepidisphaeraceae bacterium]